MDSKLQKPLRLFVNPFTLWTDFALKAGETMLASAYAAAVRAPRPGVAVIPTADVPPPETAPSALQAPALQPARPPGRAARHASKPARSKAARAKARAKSKRR